MQTQTDLFIHHLAAPLVQALGHAHAGWDEPLLGPLTGADLGASAFFLLAALLLQGLTALFLRLRRQKPAATPETLEARNHALKALGKPLYLLLWIYGLALAFAPLEEKLAGEAAVADLDGLLGGLMDLGTFAALLWLFLRLTRVLEVRLAAWAAKTPGKWDDLLVPLLGRSLRIMVPVLGVFFALPLLGLPDQYEALLSKGGSILLIGAVALVLSQLVALGEKAVLAEFDLKASDNLAARKVYTQVHVISKTFYVLIWIFAAASILMLFKEVQRFGTSILASAGVVGLIIGFAVQKTIANLFAGFQLALTQPIRIDDVVVVEGEWGRIEEITLTYVVVHIWDDRRLVVPLSYFIEKPFQNWTRTSAGILGSVFVWADYTLPVEEVRKALKGIIEGHPLWDKRFWNLQVTDATEQTQQLRVLATSENSDKSWDLRCDIREKLIALIHRDYPQCLPRFRADLFPTSGGKGGPLP